MRRWAAVAVACVVTFGLAACSGDDDDAAGSTSSAVSTATSTSTSSTTSAPASSTTTASTVPDTVATGGCNGALGFADAARVWASTNADPALEFGLEQFRRAGADPSWGRATLVPDDRTRFDAAALIGHCDGTRWTIVDAGTSGVGCGPGVPVAVQQELGVDCP